MPIDTDPTVPWDADDADEASLFPPEDLVRAAPPASVPQVPVRGIGDVDGRARRGTMLAWSRRGPSRKVLTVSVAVLALIGATALRTVLSGGRPDPALESIPNEIRSADPSTSPTASAPPLLGTADRSDGRPQQHDDPAPVAAAHARLSSATATAPAGPAAKVTAPGRAASEPRFSGALKIVTEPAGANVFVNQRLVGTSPVLLSKLPAGSHVVRVEDAGYQRWSSAVRVPAGKQTVVSAKLQRDSSH